MMISKNRWREDLDIGWGLKRNWCSGRKCLCFFVRYETDTHWKKKIVGFLIFLNIHNTYCTLCNNNNNDYYNMRHWYIIYFTWNGIDDLIKTGEQWTRAKNKKKKMNLKRETKSTKQDKSNLNIRWWCGSTKKLATIRRQKTLDTKGMIASWFGWRCLRGNGGRWRNVWTTRQQFDWEMSDDDAIVRRRRRRRMMFIVILLLLLKDVQFK